MQIRVEARATTCIRIGHGQCQRSAAELNGARAHWLQLAACAAAILVAGALDMAIGNLVGSNLFNLAILGIDDLLYLKGPLLQAVEPSHAMSAIVAAVMSGALIVALVARPAARLLNAIGWTSVLIARVCFLNAWLHFRHGG